MPFFPQIIDCLSVKYTEGEKKREKERKKKKRKRKKERTRQRVIKWGWKYNQGYQIKHFIKETTIFLCSKIHTTMEKVNIDEPLTFNIKEPIGRVDLSTNDISG